MMDRQAHAPLTVNTWGDGLYFTFESVVHANDFALDLSELVNATNWKDFGLPAELNLRIALHAVPAFEILDPVTRNKGFTGTHVSRAARIELVTPPGYVYCSESHASLVALENNGAYHCEFVGNMPYAKNYGVFPTDSLTSRKVALTLYPITQSIADIGFEKYPAHLRKCGAKSYFDAIDRFHQTEF